ncbi:DUF167 family protein [Microvirga sp. W0021]|uniref:UPF0235 protein WJT86_10795 n=1 Tax=Hohaiivirga grylli TaxID=3133970 RepID=A0ABV0BKT1_9HYPH
MTDQALPWQAISEGIELRVRVTPRGGRDAIDGVESLSDGRKVLKVRVRVVPEDGAANDAVRKLLAKSLKCPASAVSLKSGATARLKLFHIQGDGAALMEVLQTITSS